MGETSTVRLMPQLPARPLAAAALGCILFTALWMQPQTVLRSSGVAAAVARLLTPLQHSLGGAPVPLLKYLTQGLKSLTTSLHWILAALLGQGRVSTSTRHAKASNTSVLELLILSLNWSASVTNNTMPQIGGFEENGWV